MCPAECNDAYTICRNVREACSTPCTRGGLLEADSGNALVEGRGHEYKFLSYIHGSLRQSEEG